MPRKPRIEYEGAIYHIMSRGNRQDAIYLDDKDYEIFLDTLAEACRRTGWRVHAFVLMGNHYHILLESPESNLVVGMKWLQGTYTQRFNSRHKLWGHLLQGRYKAFLVDDTAGEYFSILSSYIHLNPARAKLFDLRVEKLTDYKWSSYPLYFSSLKRPQWLVVERVLCNLGYENNRKGREQYRRYIQKRVAEILYSDNPWEADEQWGNIRRNWCFGGDDFRMRMLKLLDKVIGVKGKRESFNGDESRQHDETEATRLVEMGLVELGLNDTLLQRMKKSSIEKCCLAWLVRKRTCVTNKWIMERLYMGRATNFSSLIKQVDIGGPKINTIRKKINNINISD